MLRKLIICFVALVWVPLLGLVLMSFHEAGEENQLWGWLVLGLVPLITWGVSRSSGQAGRESMATPLVALTGLIVAVFIVHFQIPHFAVKSTTVVGPALDDPDANGEKSDLDFFLGRYGPTPQEVVEKMLSFANVTEDDIVYDLGCGDGRIVVTAAKKFGARGVGVDIDPERVAESLENVKQAGVEDLVEIRLGDARNVEDIGRATVIALYVLREAAVAMRPMLEEKLAPGSRIVSHEYDFGRWEPHAMTQLYLGNKKHLIYLWKTGQAQQTPSAPEDSSAEGENAPAEIGDALEAAPSAP